MAFTVPSIADFKAYFVRDFPYGTDITTQILDADITKALADAGFNMNQSLFPDQAAFTLGYLLLSAHYMVLSIQASSQGIAGSFDWMTTSKSVGSVSASSQIPQRILDNPEFAYLSRTKYGAKYLMFILPALTAPIFIACGRTQA